MARKIGFRSEWTEDDVPAPQDSPVPMITFLKGSETGQTPELATFPREHGMGFGINPNMTPWFNGDGPGGAGQPSDDMSRTYTGYPPPTPPTIWERIFGPRK